MSTYNTVRGPQKLRGQLQSENYLYDDMVQMNNQMYGAPKYYQKPNVPPINMH